MANNYWNEQVGNMLEIKNINYKGKLQDNRDVPLNYTGKAKDGGADIGLSGKNKGKDIGLTGDSRGLEKGTTKGKREYS